MPRKMIGNVRQMLPIVLRTHHGRCLVRRDLCLLGELKKQRKRLCDCAVLISKTLDGTANPYLALAGALGAGLNGIVESNYYARW